MSNPLAAPDLQPLFPDENPDLRQAARDIIGDWWLSIPNVRLAGRTPNEVIDANEGARVRNILRSIVYIGIS